MCTRQGNGQVDVLDHIAGGEGDEAGDDDLRQHRHELSEQLDECMEQGDDPRPQHHERLVQNVGDGAEGDDEDDDLPDRQRLPVGGEDRDDLAERPIPDQREELEDRSDALLQERNDGVDDAFHLHLP